MPSRDCPCKSLIVAAAKLNAGKATLFRDKEPCRLAAIVHLHFVEPGGLRFEKYIVPM